MKRMMRMTMTMRRNRIRRRMIIKSMRMRRISMTMMRMRRMKMTRMVIQLQHKQCAKSTHSEKLL